MFVASFTSLLFWATVSLGHAPGLRDVTPTQWNALNSSVGGKLHVGIPIARPYAATISEILVVIDQQPDASRSSTLQSQAIPTLLNVLPSDKDGPIAVRLRGLLCGH